MVSNIKLKSNNEMQLETHPLMMLIHSFLVTSVVLSPKFPAGFMLYMEAKFWRSLLRNIGNI